VNLVLNKEVHQWNQGCEEGTTEPLPPFYSLGIGRAERQATQGPWNRRNKVRNHKYVVPSVIVGRCNVGPSTTSNGPKEAHTHQKFGKGRIGVCARGQDIPESY
jgi:hypothetical protein